MSKAGRIAAAAVLAALAGVHAAGAEVTIATWNLQWFPGRSPKASPEAQIDHASQVRKQLLDIDPDILCLQEVRSQEDVEGLAAILPGHTVHVVSRFPKAFGRSQQLAISSRLPAVAADQVAFRATPQSPPRGFAFATFDLGGHHLFIYSVHFKSNIGGIAQNIGTREESARQLLEHVSRTEADFAKQGATDVTFVIAGDFNTDPNDERFLSEATGALLAKAGFRNCWDGVPFEDRVTWPSNGTFPDACFDHVWVRSDLGTPVAAVVEGTDSASDHRAVVVTITLGGHSAD